MHFGQGHLSDVCLVGQAWGPSAVEHQTFALRVRKRKSGKCGLKQLVPEFRG